MTDTRSGIDLYWLPLGAGGHSVRLNGRIFEAIAAHRAGRPASRGVVAVGAVVSEWAGRFRLFRYEVRRWRDGIIPDVVEAVESPRQLSHDERDARRLIELVPLVPTPVWGRDELRAGEMWNPNSLISWLLATTGLPAGELRPPRNGRAPGWQAGLVVARRDPLHAGT